jgi:hypothetical protein
MNYLLLILIIFTEMFFIIGLSFYISIRKMNHPFITRNGLYIKKKKKI